MFVLTLSCVGFLSDFQRTEVGLEGGGEESIRHDLLISKNDSAH